jgi:hypothetical protein
VGRRQNKERTGSREQDEGFWWVLRRFFFGFFVWREIGIGRGGEVEGVERRRAGNGIFSICPAPKDTCPIPSPFVFVLHQRYANMLNRFQRWNAV